MHEQKHPKIYIAFLIFSLLLAALLFLTSATVYAVSLDYPREASEAASKPSAEESKAESSSASSEMQQLKQSAEKQVQQAKSEQEVRETYHNFQKQAKQVKQQSAKETRQISKPKQRRAALTGRSLPARTQNQAASPDLKSTSREARKTSNHKKTVKKASEKEKPKRKLSRNKKQMEQTSKNRVQTKTNRQKAAENGASNPYPALVILSLFLSFAMIRLSVFGGNNGIEITFMELHKKEGGA